MEEAGSKCWTHNIGWGRGGVDREYTGRPELAHSPDFKVNKESHIFKGLKNYLKKATNKNKTKKSAYDMLIICKYHLWYPYVLLAPCRAHLFILSVALLI